MNWKMLVKRTHKANEQWWVDLKTGLKFDRNLFGLLALVISEFCEALEGERKDLMDDKLPHRKMAEVEMADALIRLLDICGGFGVVPETTDEEIFIANDKAEAIYMLINQCTLIPFTESALDLEEMQLLIEMIIAYCQKFGYDIMSAYEEKMEYNAKRLDHTHKERLKKHGKKF